MGTSRLVTSSLPSVRSYLGSVRGGVLRRSIFGAAFDGVETASEGEAGRLCASDEVASDGVAIISLSSYRSSEELCSASDGVAKG